jgi:hypothetical protein
MTDAAIPAGLVPRVKAILLSPRTEWPVIAEEPATIADLYTRYIMILAAIPVVVGFLSMSVIGVSIPFLGGTYHVPMLTGILYAVIGYALSLIGIYVLSLIIDALAPTFGGTKNSVQALKAAGYAYTAYWVASIATIVPVLGALIILAGGLYSLYLLYIGLPVMMRSPADRALPYTALVLVCGIVIAIVLGAITNMIVGFGALSYGMPGSITNNDNVEFDPESPMGQLEQWANQLEQAGQNLEAAQASGDAQAQQDALGQMFGAALGGNNGVEPLSIDDMRGYVPDEIAGLPRTSISVERNAAMGIQMAHATATYSDGTTTLDLEISDFGGSMGLMAMAAWAGVESESQTDTGYERIYKDGARTIQERWEGASMYGEMSVILNSRVLVEVDGNVQDMDTVKDALDDVDLDALENL